LFFTKASKIEEYPFIALMDSKKDLNFVGW
jgi:hypothetical protein